MNQINGARRSHCILAVASSILVVCSTWGCPGRTANTAEEAEKPVWKAKRSTNPALWGPVEAFDLHLGSRGKADYKFNYRVHERYPAKKTLDRIKAHLQNAGWTALKEDALNPGTLSSLTCGWSRFGDIQGPTEKTIRRWIAEWQNKHGDYVRYSLRYETEVDKPEDLSEVVVYAWYLTAEDFKTALREAEKMRAQPATGPSPPPR